MTLYMVTIHKSKVKDYVSEEELREILRILFSKDIKILDYTFECHGVYRQLHCHAIVMLPNDTWYSSKVKGYRLYWKKVFDCGKALKYLHKQAYSNITQERILQENQYKKYRFISD